MPHPGRLTMYSTVPSFPISAARLEGSEDSSYNPVLFFIFDRGAVSSVGREARKVSSATPVEPRSREAEGGLALRGSEHVLGEEAMPWGGEVGPEGGADVSESQDPAEDLAAPTPNVMRWNAPPTPPELTSTSASKAGLPIRMKVAAKSCFRS